MDENQKPALSTADQIAALQAQIKRLREVEDTRLRQNADKIASVKAQIDAILAESGVTLDQCYPKAKKGRAKSGDGRAAVAVKYADGKGGTWTGRGKQPVWLRDAIAGGRQLSAFAVEQAPTVLV